MEEKVKIIAPIGHADSPEAVARSTLEKIYTRTSHVTKPSPEIALKENASTSMAEKSSVVKLHTKAAAETAYQPHISAINPPIHPMQFYPLSLNVTEIVACISELITQDKTKEIEGIDSLQDYRYAFFVTVKSEKETLHTQEDNANPPMLEENILSTHKMPNFYADRATERAIAS